MGDRFIAVSRGLKLCSVELNSLILLGLGEREFDDDGEDPRESRRFSDPSIPKLGGERLELLERGLTVILPKRLIFLKGALALCHLGGGPGSRPRKLGRDGGRGSGRRG